MKWLIAAVAALVIGLLTYQVFRLHPGSSRAGPGDASPRSTPSDNALTSLRDLMRSSFDYEGFRTAISQLNVYVENAAPEKPSGISPQEKDLLLKRYMLDDAELAEINRTSYTPLDAHYLDLCFLLRDALRSLKVEQLQPVDQAATSFAWAMRQVRLSNDSGDLLPPDFVLRRGWGNAHERALVYLAALERLGLPGCMVVFPAPPANRFWVGALVNRDIYLFDTRLGVALPGPDGKGIATLAQLRTDPKLLQGVDLDHKSYDVHAGDMAKGDVQVAGSLSALAPRMRYLERLLATTEDIRLATDPSAVFSQFQTAVGQGVEVHVWNQRGSWDTPFRVARHFFPVEEGGVGAGDQRARALQALVPARYYPLFQTFPLGSDPGDRLYQAVFALPFVAFHSQARLPRDLAQAWLPGLFEQNTEARRKPGGPDADQKPKGAEVLEHERMPRDLLLRGRYPEATALLVAVKGELQRQKSVLQKQMETEGLADQISRWCERARQEYAAYYKTRNASPSRRADTPAATGPNLQQLWQQAGPVVLYIQGCAAEPMYRDVLYQLALTKQEQAERAQAQLDQLRRNGKSPNPSETRAAEMAFKSAATWWDALVSDPGAAEYHPSAQVFLARCRAGEHTARR
jgi:hypothetical protein